MNLDHLLDLACPAAALPAEQRQQLRRLKTMRLSCAAAYDATGRPELLDFTDPQRADCRRAIARAQWTQGRPQRSSTDGAWQGCCRPLAPAAAATSRAVAGGFVA